MTRTHKLTICFLGGFAIGSLFHPTWGLNRTGQSPEIDKRLQWISDNAVVVRSIEPADEDFGDLLPLAESIGTARVVQIGEASHSAGTDFMTKVRLIKFLHEKMGFDVLVWESGLFDCREVDTALRTDLPLAEAARKGVFGIWVTEETLPLFEYVRTTWKTDRPLRMAGFDEQFSSKGAPTRFLADLNAFFDAVGPRFPGNGIRESLGELVALMEDRTLNPESHRKVSPAIAGAIEAIDTNESSLARVRDSREIAFFRRTLKDLQVFSASTAARNTPEFAKGMEDPAVLEKTNSMWNARDAQNAENMLWLLNEYFRGKKLIVWAHNGHVMSCYYNKDWGSLTLKKPEGAIVPMGLFLKEALGHDVYTIGLTGFSVQKGALGPGAKDFAPPAPPADSIEHLCHLTGHPHLFIDFRRLEADPEHWLRKPIVFGGRGYTWETIEDWTKAFDAVFFNDVIQPSRMIAVQPTPK
jgi:erythromycin esterase